MFRLTRYKSVVELLNHFHSAASDANLAKYFGCFYSSSSRFLGTDASENWTAEEFYNYSKPHFDAGKAWTYTPRASTRKIEELEVGGGGTLLPTKIATFDELLDSESFVATTRGTGTAVFDAELQCWFLLSYHLSFPTPNDLAGRICSIIALSERKERASTTDAANQAKAEEAAAQLLAELELEDAASSGAKGKGAKKKKGGKA
jgi:hypothetical protein